VPWRDGARAAPAEQAIELLGTWSTVMQNAIDDRGVMSCRFGGDQRRSIAPDKRDALALIDR
jgi:hypothetical protein